MLSKLVAPEGSCDYSTLNVEGGRFLPHPLTWLSWIPILNIMVRYDPELLDDDGEIPKSQGRGWQFNSRLWNLLSTWQRTCQVVNCLMCFGVGMSAFCLKNKEKKSSSSLSKSYKFHFINGSQRFHLKT